MRNFAWTVFTAVTLVAPLACAQQSAPQNRRMAQTFSQPVAQPFIGRQYFASPNVERGDGSQLRPFGLEEAFSRNSPLKPGDVLWLRGGVYRGNFRCDLKGTAQAPIVVRPFNGERAIFDAADAEKTRSLNLTGSGVWFWGFEISNSLKSQFRRRTNENNEDRPTPSAIEVTGDDDKLINLLIHDTGIGITLSQHAENTEIVGCVIYNTGMNRLDHGIYAQNENGTKFIRNNVIFNASGQGIHIWGDKGPINGFVVENNTLFNNGSLDNANALRENIFVGGHVEADRIDIHNNYIYSWPESSGIGIKMGYNTKAENGSGAVVNNYIATSVPLFFNRWKQMKVTGNTLIVNGEKGQPFVPQFAETDNWRGFDWDNNTYRPSPRGGFRARWGEREAKTYDFGQWQATTGFDRRSTVLQPLALGDREQKIFIATNPYERGRANVTIFNWANAPTVDINLASSGLQNGQRFEIRDAQNYFGVPLYAGTYDGRAIRVGVGNLTAPPPPGTNQRVPHTAPQFTALIVLPVSQASSTTLPPTTPGSNNVVLF